MIIKKIYIYIKLKYMSKTSNIQKIECFKDWLEQFKKGRKYQKPKITMQDIVDIRIRKAEFDVE